MDYAFMSSDDEHEEHPKVLVVHDDSNDGLWALWVEKNGASAEVVAWIFDKIEEAEHSGQQISLKTDQEESIMALKRAEIVRRKVPIVPIESKVRVSESNPRIERAIRTWRGQFRKLKLELEGRMHRRMEVDHPAAAWLASWAADVVLNYREQTHGRTAYADITGHKARHNVAGVGESVLFKLATNPSNQIKCDGEWQSGHVVGVITRTSEYLVMRDNVIFKCHTMRRRTAG